MDQKINVLIIANKMVFPALDGGALAMQNLCKILIDQKYNIDLISIAKNNNTNTLKQPTISKHNQHINQILFEKNMQFNLLSLLQSIFENKAYQAFRFYHKKIQKFIQKLIDEKKYKIIIFESIFTMIYFDKLYIKKSTKTIFRAHNVENKIWSELANNQQMKKIVFLWLAKQIEKMEQITPKNIDYIFTLSNNDASYFKKLFPKKTHNIPVTFEPHMKHNKKIKNSIFHLGAMDWAPNIEGIEWFLTKVKPLLNTKDDIKIYIAGKNMPSEYFMHKDIIIESSVKNAQNYIQDKEILFVPLFSGSGIRIKILEAMSLGIPVVSTTQGAEGIPYINNQNILIANTEKDFADAIHKLIANKKLAKDIGKNGQKLIIKHFSKKSVIAKWKKTIY
tara:strand:- start:2420 stop:3595 length:1176 start_codon:yes stop_codon:yes gene_type:complete